MAGNMTWADYAKSADSVMATNGGSLAGGVTVGRYRNVLDELGRLLGMQGTMPAQVNLGTMNEGGDTNALMDTVAANPELLRALQAYQIQQNPGEYQAGLIDPSGRNVGSFTSGDKPTGFDKFAEAAIPLAISALAAGAAGGWIPGTEGAGTAIGNGAFLGEGVASGVPAWDAAAGLGGIGSSVAPVGASELAAYGASLAPGELAGAVSGLNLGGSGLGTVGGGMTAGGGLGAGTIGGGGGLTGSLGGAGGLGSLGGAGAGPTAPFSWGNLATSAIGPALSTGLQLYGANKAAGAMSDATNRANALDAPALEARNSALAQMQALLKDPSTLTSQPDYQFGLDQGTKTLNNGAAARGMTYSGAQGKALQRYGQDYAGSKLDQSFNRLNALASAGQPGATATSNNITAQGNADAAKYLVGGNALGTAVNGLTAYGQRQGWWGAPG